MLMPFRFFDENKLMQSIYVGRHLGTHISCLDEIAEREVQFLQIGNDFTAADYFWHYERASESDPCSPLAST
jgi:hypothetical protein